MGKAAKEKREKLPLKDNLIYIIVEGGVVQGISHSTELPDLVYSIIDHDEGDEDDIEELEEELAAKVKAGRYTDPDK